MYECDGCGSKPIVGTRHANGPTVDYDLCSTCWGKLPTADQTQYQSVEPTDGTVESLEDFTSAEVAANSIASSARRSIAAGRHGEVPVGEHLWECWQANWVEGSEMNEFLERPLTLTELSTEEAAAEAARAAAE